MLYVGDGNYMHCTSGPGRGIDYSYDYVKKRNQDRPAGGVRLDLAKYLVTETPEGQVNDCHYFFEPKYRCISVSRPLDLVGEPTTQAKIRQEKFKGLWTGVESSHSGGHHAVPGETVTYRIIIRNLTEKPRDAEIHFEAAEGSSLVGTGETALTLAAKEEKTIFFPVTVMAEAGRKVKLEGPKVTINGLDIYTQPVLLGKPISQEQQNQIAETVLAEMTAGSNSVKAAAKAYAEHGISMEQRKEEYFFSHFYLHDASVGTDVLSRRPQNPYEDMAVYSYFGGIGVITAEMGSSTGIRTTRIGVSDLMPGDIILCSEDTFGKRSYASFYDGNCLTGSFDVDEETRTIEGKELAAFVDSLLGRFCWMVLRPWLAR
ncbi:MAG: hypothetical protein IJ443_01145, partial [Firmicutes bacterium]|nr:hypothetical protein [Bacillota bacterium]